MVDRSGWKSVFEASQRGSLEEVLCVRSWSNDGWPSFHVAICLLRIHTLIYPVASLLSLTWYIMTLSFTWPCIPFLTWVGGLLLCTLQLFSWSESIMSTLCHCSFVPFVGCSWFFFPLFGIVALSIFEFCFYRVVSSLFCFPLCDDDVLPSQYFKSSMSHPSFHP